MIFAKHLAEFPDPSYIFVEFYIVHPTDPLKIALAWDEFDSRRWQIFMGFIEEQFDILNDAVRIPILKVKPGALLDWLVKRLFDSSRPLIDAANVEGYNDAIKRF